MSAKKKRKSRKKYNAQRRFDRSLDRAAREIGLAMLRAEVEGMVRWCEMSRRLREMDKERPFKKKGGKYVMPIKLVHVHGEP